MVSTKSQNREHKINVRNLSGPLPVCDGVSPTNEVCGRMTQAAKPLGARRRQSRLKECAGPFASEAARMITQGEDLNAPCRYGYLILHWATSEGDGPTVKLLIEHGADVNAYNVDGFTPLMISAQEDKLEITKYLIEKGADVNAKSEDGKTALDLAKEAGHQDVAALLRQYGAKE